MLATTKRTVRQARALRRTMTLPEVLLWRALRLRPEGLKFRRQHPSGPFILDFFIASVRGLQSRLMGSRMIWVKIPSAMRRETLGWPRKE